MARTLRQVRALMLLWLRSLVPTVTKNRGAAIAQTLALRAAMLLGLGGALGAPGVAQKIPPLEMYTHAGTIWSFVGVQALFLIRRTRGVQMTPADDARATEALPLGQPTRVLFSVLSGLPFVLLVASFKVATHAFRLTPTQWGGVVGQTIAMISIFALLSAAWEAIRRLLFPYAQPSKGLGLGEDLFVLLPTFVVVSVLPDPRTLVLLYGGACTAAFLLLYAAEKRGYDRFPPVVYTRVPRQRAFGPAAMPINPATLSKLAISRSGSPFWAVAFPVILIGLSCLGTLALIGRGEYLWELLWGLSAFTALVGFLAAFVLAARLASFDAAARPLLAPLTLEPRDLIQGRAAAIRRRAMVYLLVLLPALALVRPLGMEPVLRLALVGATLWIACSVVTSVAFLTSGPAAVGSPRLPLPGGLLLLLLLTLVMGCSGSLSILSGLPSLAALAALDFEARRACQRCVRWWDDPSPELARSTAVWQAVVVLGLFMTVATWGSLLFWWAPLELRPIAGYLIAGLVVLITMWKRRDVLPPLRWRPTAAGWAAWLPLGVGAAAGIGMLAARYGKWAEQSLDRLSPFLRRALEEAVANQRGWAFGALAVIAAPIVEECFFRGWLQQAIRAELDPRWRRLAIPIAALGFAAIHPGLSFPPVFAMGLLLGLLYDSGGGLIAAIAAHATYNAVVVVAAH